MSALETPSPRKGAVNVDGIPSSNHHLDGLQWEVEPCSAHISDTLSDSTSELQRLSLQTSGLGSGAVSAENLIWVGG